MLESVHRSPRRLRSRPAMSMPQPIYANPFEVVKSTKFICGMPIVVGAPQPLTSLASSGPDWMGLQPGRASRCPKTCSWMDGGTLQPLVTESGRISRKGQSSTAPEFALQALMAFCKVDVFHPLIKSPCRAYPVSSPMAQTKGWWLPYHIFAKSAVFQMTS
jgi:hypothetical protein